MNFQTASYSWNQKQVHENVAVYVKLPGWFWIPTPLGKYNPDWAVVVQEDGGQRLYLVKETKGTDGGFLGDLRGSEGAKILCGSKHFEGVGTGVRFEWGV